MCLVYGGTQTTRPLYLCRRQSHPLIKRVPVGWIRHILVLLGSENCPNDDVSTHRLQRYSPLYEKLPWCLRKNYGNAHWNRPRFHKNCAFARLLSCSCLIHASFGEGIGFGTQFGSGGELIFDFKIFHLHRNRVQWWRIKCHVWQNHERFSGFQFQEVRDGILKQHLRLIRSNGSITNDNSP